MTVQPPTTKKAMTPDTTGTDGGVYALSDLDLAMPDTVVIFFLVYERRPSDNVQLIIESFRDGLMQAAEQLPSLSAHIQFDRGKKPLKEMTRGTFGLHVRSFESEEHKSYEELAEKSFLPSDFDRQRLLPIGTWDDTEERSFCIPQLNFISGGVILALAYNHIPADMTAMDLAITLICECIKVRMKGLSVSRHYFDYNSERFAASPELLALSKDQLLARLEDYNIIQVPNSPKALEINALITKGAIYRIEGQAAQRLKKCCVPQSGVAYVSTYDCVVGMLWKNVMKIRVAMNPHLMTSQSRLGHPVDLRNRFGQQIPANYFGNAVSVASGGPVSMADLVGPNGLSLAASSIRQSIQNTSRSSIADVTALGTMLGPTEKLLYSPGGLLEENFLLTSWYSVDTQAWDFGLGPPETVRSWEMPMPGCGILFPNCKPQGQGRIYDVFLILSEAEQDMLTRDKEVRHWFHVL